MTLTTTEKDLEFFNAVYSLMINSFPEMAEKFGIWRIHEHFEPGQDEVFHETSDSQTRESTLKLIKKTALPPSAFASTWKLTKSGPIVANWCCDDSPSIKPTP